MTESMGERYTVEEPFDRKAVMRHFGLGKLQGQLAENVAAALNAAYEAGRADRFPALEEAERRVVALREAARVLEVILDNEFDLTCDNWLEPLVRLFENVHCAESGDIKGSGPTIAAAVQDWEGKKTAS